MQKTKYAWQFFPLYRALLLFVGLLSLAPITLAANTPQPLSDNWQYRWGDSPFSAEGIPQWTKEPASEQWQPITFPSNPPERNGQTNVWYRTTLPAGDWRDPAIYIFSVDLITEVYVDGKRIYHFGEFDEFGQGKFSGWPWHLITLPRDFAGKTIYFRIFSDYTDIGLWGEVLIGSRTSLLSRIVRADLSNTVLGALSILIGLFALLLYSVEREQKSFLFLALFAFCEGIELQHQTGIKQLVINAPLAWQYAAAIAYFTLPIALAAFMEQLLGPGYRRSIRRVWQLHLLYLVGSISLVSLGVIHLSSTYPPFDWLFAFTLLILGGNAVHLSLKDNIEARVLAVVVIVAGLLWLYDMATAHGLLPWAEQNSQWRILLFTIALSLLLVRRFAVTHQNLKTLNLKLEDEVSQRTAQIRRQNVELEKANQRLQALATTDGLTQVFNRRHFLELANNEMARVLRSDTTLSVAILDADHFKSINDRYGHAIGDEVLQRLAGICRSVLRHTDFIGRLGGEEFAICLVDTPLPQAVSVIERLRHTIADTTLKTSAGDLHFTVSIGVTELQPHDEAFTAVLHRADLKLLAAKQGGRNAVVAA